jgi:type 1 glutamine amidotransferase
VLAIAGAAAFAILAGEALADDEKPATASSVTIQQSKIRVAIIVGGHGYDKKPFPAMFEAMGDAEFVIRTAQEPDKPHLFDDPNNFPYDVIFLYNMSNKLTAGQGENFLKLLDKGVGLVVCHHAITGFQDWPGWPDLIGARYFLNEEMFRGEKGIRSIWKDDVDLKMHVEDANHPITRGLKDYDTCDETYGKWRFLPGNVLLVSTEHPLSNKQIAWVRPQGDRRVFVLLSGHGPLAWNNPGFRHLLSQGIRWAARRLDGKEKKVIGLRA